MKICFLVDSIFNHGGVQRVVSVVANELCDFYEVYVVCTSREFSIDRSLYNLDKRIKVEINDELINIGKMNSLYSKTIRGINKLTEVFKSNIFTNIITSGYYNPVIQQKMIKYFNENKYDVIIGVEGNNSVLLGIISSKINSRTIGWQHNSYDAYFNNPGKYYWKQDNIFKKNLPNLDKCIVLTKEDKNKYEELLRCNAITIYNPLGFNSKKKSKCNNNNILFVGRLVEEQKGLDFLVEAFVKILKFKKDCRLLIVGDGIDKEKLINLIHNNNIEKYVELHPFTNKVEDYYINSSVFISTSRWEGFGLVIIEAMECGLPVVAFANSGPKEIINNDEKNGVLINPGDVDELVNSVIKILDNDELRKFMSEQSIKRANDFNIDIISKQWRKVIEYI